MPSNEQSSHKLTSSQYHQLQLDSPQMNKEFCILNDNINIGEFQLQTASTMTVNVGEQQQQKRKNKRKRRVTNNKRQSRQTNVIKVRPVDRISDNNTNHQQEQQQEQQDNNKDDDKQQQLEVDKQYQQSQHNQGKNNNINVVIQQKFTSNNKIHQIEDSPILYRFSDDDHNDQQLQQVNNNNDSSKYNNQRYKQQQRQERFILQSSQSSRRAFRQQQQQQHYQYGQQSKQRQKQTRNTNSNNSKRLALNKRNKRQLIIHRQKCEQKTKFFQQQLQQQQQQQQIPEQQHQSININSEHKKDNLNTILAHKKQQCSNNQSQIYVYGDDQSQQQQQQQQKQHNQQQIMHKTSNNNSNNNDTINQHKSSSIIFKSQSFFTLINSPVPANNYVNCLIKRMRANNISQSNSLFSKFQSTVTYQIYLLEDKKFLISCVKKRLFNFASHFQFYRQKKDNNNNTKKYNKQNLYAVLDSNFTGTEFVLKSVVKNDTISQRSTAVDKGDNVVGGINNNECRNSGGGVFGKQSKANDQHINKEEIKQSCFISFKANLFGFGGQRQVKLLKKKNKKIQKTLKFSDIKQAYQRGQFDKVEQLHNKKATCGKNGLLQLDLKSNAKMQSTKNVILQNSLLKQGLIFGKIKEDVYSVSIRSPLSILEGLAFGVANLDWKVFVN